MYQENEVRKLAILIDAENVSPKYITLIMREASVLGTIKYKRIYGNFASNSLHAWESTIVENAMIPVQQYNNTKGKNSSDSALIIDAMDLLYTGDVDAFCLVTSDSDFTRLATRLRESEMFVVGMGEQKTAKSFINACNKYVYLDVLTAQENKKKQQEQQAVKAKEKKEAVAKAKNSTNTAASMTGTGQSGINVRAIREAIESILDEKSDDEGWVFSGVLGNMLNQRYPDFDVRNFGFKKFVPFVKSLGNFEIQKRSRGDNEGVDLVYIRNKDV